MMGKEITCEECGEYFCQERDRAKRLEKQAGIQFQWQLESPAKEYLEQVKCCNDTACTHRMMMQGFVALNSGDWEEYKNESHGMGL